LAQLTFLVTGKLTYSYLTAGATGKRTIDPLTILVGLTLFIYHYPKRLNMVDMSDRDEGMWKAALQDMHIKFKEYNAAKKKGKDDAEEEKQVVKAIKRVADSHPDPQVRVHWQQRAESFQNGDDNAKTHILEDIGKGLGILLITPFALVAAVLFGAGAVIYGVGSVVKGLGNLLTGGVLG